MTDRDQAIVEGLLKITDRVSAALANHQGPHGETGTLESLLEINEFVWELRWAIGLFGERLEELKSDDKTEAAS